MTIRWKAEAADLKSHPSYKQALIELRNRGLSPHTPKGEALLAELLAASPGVKTRNATQPQVAPDIDAYRKEEARWREEIRVLKIEVTKLEKLHARNDIQEARLDTLNDQIKEARLKLSGLTKSIRAALARKPN
jgi:hypothetical protein